MFKKERMTIIKPILRNAYIHSMASPKRNRRTLLTSCVILVRIWAGEILLILISDNRSICSQIFCRRSRTTRSPTTLLIYVRKKLNRERKNNIPTNASIIRLRKRASLLIKMSSMIILMTQGRTRARRLADNMQVRIKTILAR